MATKKETKYKSWGSIPIGKYEKIKEIIRSGGDESDIEIIAVLCDCSVDEILNLPISEVIRLKKDILFLNKPLDVRNRLRHKAITIDGVKYIVHTDFRNITTAQYLDFQTFYKDFEKNYCNLLACFIIPEGHKYNDGYDALETAELFREKMPVEVAENALFFSACRSRTSLLRGIKALIWRTTVMATKTKDEKIRENLMRTRMALVKQNDAIDGLGKLMKSLIQKG